MTVSKSWVLVLGLLGVMACGDEDDSAGMRWSKSKTKGPSCAGSWMASSLWATALSTRAGRLWTRLR